MLRNNGLNKSGPMLYKSAHYTNRELHEVLPDNSWLGKPAFLIGGGPSLKGFDWRRLKGKRTIGINRAFEKFDPTIIFSMDTRYLDWVERNVYGHAVKMKLLKSAAYKVWQCTYIASLPAFIFIVKVWRDYQQGARAFTSSMKDGLGHGDNSGYAALNLACCLGANPIYLLGFDGKHEENATHWHEGHPSKQLPAQLVKFGKFFAWAAPIIKARGIEVINLNPDSAINCFTKRTTEGIL